MKLVLVTGASSGIGHAAARRMAEKGFQVVAGVRKESDARAWKKVTNARAVLLDVTSDASVSDAMAELRPLLEAAAEVHLVNNAGIAIAGPVEGVALARWKEQFEVNVFGLVRATQAMLPYIRATKGRIVNISSVSGLATMPYLGPYSASKFAVEAISDALRRELRHIGSQVIVVEPGPVATPIWEKNMGRQSLVEELPQALRPVYEKALGRFQRGVAKSARGAVPVDRVSNIVEKALCSPRPRTRYIVGRPALPMQMALAAHLPDAWLDSVLAPALR